MRQQDGDSQHRLQISGKRDSCYCQWSLVVFLGGGTGQLVLGLKAGFNSLINYVNYFNYF